jgi:Uma2 family endonuclease
MGNTITNISQLSSDVIYTYSDYLTWQFDEMVELIKGKVFKMSPAPSDKHQLISSNLHRDISYFFKNKKCSVRHAPYDVRLPIKDKKGDKEIITVVQPDICVICDRSKIDDRGCLGAPDWIIEILSPSTSAKDTKFKMAVYEEVGVNEYWMVYPYEQIIETFILNENKKYNKGEKYTVGDKISPQQFPSLEIVLEEVFFE